MTIEVLAIINGEPSVNAGARLRMTNWITALEPTSPLHVATLQQRQHFWPLFQHLRRWLRLTCGQREDEHGNVRRVVIVQKAYSMKIIAILAWVRLAGVAIVQDICDPPIKYFNPRPFSRSFLALFYLSIVSYFFADHITVPTSVLARSFSTAKCGITRIPDCIDANHSVVGMELPSPDLIFNEVQFNNPIQPLPNLRLLWFGSPARADGHSGIHEIYAALSDFQQLSNHYRLQLDLCTDLREEHLEALKRWSAEADFMTIHYYRWSVPMQSRLLQECDFHFFPRLQSLATFYKSPNRVALAASLNVRTLANMIPSDDYRGMNIILVEDLIQSPMADPRRLPEGSDPLPRDWTIREICAQWQLTLENVCSQGRAKNSGLNKAFLGLTFVLLLPFVLLPQNIQKYRPHKHTAFKKIIRASRSWSGQ